MSLYWSLSHACFLPELKAKQHTGVSIRAVLAVLFAEMLCGGSPSYTVQHKWLWFQHAPSCRRHAHIFSRGDIPAIRQWIKIGNHQDAFPSDMPRVMVVLHACTGAVCSWHTMSKTGFAEHPEAARHARAIHWPLHLRGRLCSPPLWPAAVLAPRFHIGWVHENAQHTRRRPDP